MFGECYVEGDCIKCIETRGSGFYHFKEYVFVIIGENIRYTSSKVGGDVHIEIKNSNEEVFKYVFQNKEDVIDVLELLVVEDELSNIIKKIKTF
jgi:hypothetical protein